MADSATAERTYSLRHALLVGVFAIIWLLAVILVFAAAQVYIKNGWIGGDLHAYWRAARSAHPYGIPSGVVDAYEYSPVFVQLIRPLGLLPFGVAYGLWAAVEATIFVWLTRGLKWWWRVPVLLACCPELLLGNLHGFYSLVLVGVARFPEGWALPLLTKVTPGGVGFLWYAARGEWRTLGQVSIRVAAVVAVSVALQSHLWLEWFDYLRSDSTGETTGVVVRCIVAAALTLFAVRTRSVWMLPAAFVIAEPVPGGINKDLAMIPVTLYLARFGASAPRARNGADRGLKVGPG